MKRQVNDFLRSLVLLVIAAAALCIFCFVMFGSHGAGTPFAALALVFPVLGVLEFMLPTPDYND